MMTNGINKEINDVLNGKGSKAIKVQTLVEKIGVSRVEASMLYNMWRENNPTQPRSSFNYTFGVEIECGVSSSTFIDYCRQFGVYCRPEGYNHDDHHDGRTFKLVRDGSLCITNAIECVSPVLNGKPQGFKALQSCCKALHAAGASVNKSCGLHIHIGCADMTDAQYVNVFKNYKALEAVIDSFMAESRRCNNSRWCASLSDHVFDNCTTPAQVSYVLRHDRYHKVNAESWHRHHTIEFRQHQGTTDYRKIAAWARFCAKLVEYSRSNVITSCRSIDEIPFLTANEKAFFKARKNELAA